MLLDFRLWWTSDSRWRQTLSVSFWRIFRLWWSSDSDLQHKLPLLNLLLSFVLSEPILWFKTYKFLSMFLHTWTNISISNWFFNTLLSSKLKGGNVKTHFVPTNLIWFDLINMIVRHLIGFLQKFVYLLNINIY